jgi:alkylation response protein AidB-like acyl-CoA dehydrogenase
VSSARDTVRIPWATDEQNALFKETVEFARSLTTQIRDHDREGTFPREDWKRCGMFGLAGLPGPQEYGGAGAGAVTTVLALEAFGYGCEDAGLAFALNAHLWTSVVTVAEFGSEDQRQRWLPGLCSGDLIGCHAITEPAAGSDVFSLTTTATPVNDGWLLNGEKAFITNAPEADVMIVFARSGPGLGPLGITAFIVDPRSHGCEITAVNDKMGLRTASMGSVRLDDCHVGKNDILGRADRGAVVFQASMRWERGCIMASQVGGMRRILDRCVEYAKNREQFGKPIGKFGSVAGKIANMKIAVDAGHALLMQVAWLMDQGSDTERDAAVAKTFVSEAAVQVHLDAIQVHGGLGYLSDAGIERGLRDAVGGTIYSGTSEIQRRVIARGLGL